MMFILLVALAVFLPGLQAFQYTGELYEGAVIYACQNSNVSLPWQILLAPTDNITDIQWFRRRETVEMLGVFTYGSFVAFPGLTDKVSHTTNASIILYNVKLHESGNYTVQVTGSNITRRHYELRQTVFVQISDHLMTRDGSVHVNRVTYPVLNEATGQWFFQLTCGDFNFMGPQPPYDVQWILPRGEVQNSSKYEHGHFYLPLTSSLLGGNYTCRVPLNKSCLTMKYASHGEDYMNVDNVDTRLSLLEKENKQLKHRLQIHTQEETRYNVHLEKKIEQLKVRLEGVTDTCQGPIRLVGGRNEREGRVEIRLGKTWGTVCDDGWDSNEAKVVCNMLGYFQSGARAMTEAHFGQGTGHIVLDDLACTGRESDIRLCRAFPFGASNCHHDEDAGVVCVG